MYTQSGVILAKECTDDSIHGTKKLQINYLDRDRYKIYHFVGSISRANNQQLLTEVEVSIHHFHPNEVIIVSVYVGFVT